MEIKRNTYLYPVRTNDSAVRLKDSFGKSTIVHKDTKLYDLIGNLNGLPLSYSVLSRSKDAIYDEVEFLYNHFEISLALWLNGRANIDKHYCRNAIANYDDKFCNFECRKFNRDPASRLFQFHTNIEQDTIDSKYFNKGVLGLIVQPDLEYSEDGVDHLAIAYLGKGYNAAPEVSNIKFDIIETGKDIILDGYMYSVIIK